MAKVQQTIRTEIPPQKYLESCTYQELIELEAIMRSNYLVKLKSYKLDVEARDNQIKHAYLDFMSTLKPRERTKWPLEKWLKAQQKKEATA
jgi:hypothetical protein